MITTIRELRDAFNEISAAVGVASFATTRALPCGRLMEAWLGVVDRQGKAYRLARTVPLDADLVATGRDMGRDFVAAKTEPPLTDREVPEHVKCLVKREPVKAKAKPKKEQAA